MFKNVVMGRVMFTHPQEVLDEWESNPGHIGGRQVLSPLCHPCSLSCVTKNLEPFRVV